jgi:hypothetical protein
MRVRDLPYGDNYKILVLQGHWSRAGFESDGTYKYVESEPPTLLAAGYRSILFDSTVTKVEIKCYPIGVDTQFSSTSPASTVDAALPVLGTAPTTALVSGTTWQAKWTVKRYDVGGRRRWNSQTAG